MTGFASVSRGWGAVSLLFTMGVPLAQRFYGNTNHRTSVPLASLGPFVNRVISSGNHVARLRRVGWVSELHFFQESLPSLPPGLPLSHNLLLVPVPSFLTCFR
ncbi:hypothetical protein [Crucivirus-407]|nr:hypothetical protein [Crucivirus-406]QMW68869.1 hypothetical protein [Crucivirus-407]